MYSFALCFKYIDIKIPLYHNIPEAPDTCSHSFLLTSFNLFLFSFFSFLQYRVKRVIRCAPFNSLHSLIFFIYHRLVRLSDTCSTSSSYWVSGKCSHPACFLGVESLCVGIPEPFSLTLVYVDYILHWHLLPDPYISCVLALEI